MFDRLRKSDAAEVALGEDNPNITTVVETFRLARNTPPLHTSSKISEGVVFSTMLNRN